MNNETLPDELRAWSDDRVITDAAKAVEHLLARVSALRETVQAQASVIANYKQLATTDIDDAVALRAQLEALQCGAKTVPLTDEQISDAIYKADAQHDLEFQVSEWPVIFTRAIESAHGITGEPK